MPLTKVKFNKYKHKKNNWITVGILQSIRYRDKLYKKVKTAVNDSESFILKHNLRVYSNILKISIRNAKRTFYKDKFNKFRNSSKDTWKTINDVLNKNSSKGIPDFMLDHDNTKVHDKETIANMFNEYFNQIGAKMASKFTVQGCKSHNEYMHTNVNTNFQFSYVAEPDLKKIITNLNAKTSSGYDAISSILLKKIEPLIVGPLAIIINQSLQTGVFPSKLKIAKIIPIHTKDNCHVIDNYRPISLLPVISKVIEKVVHNQIYNYFVQHNYLSASQYGFRHAHSTGHAILEIVDRITQNLDEGHTPLAVFLDLSKAFDTFNIDILLDKLKYYGIRNDWFGSYLTNRPHFVEFDNNRSSTKYLSLGVPQGSVLGPLLFTIYVNDIEFSSIFLKFIQYADDTNLLSLQFKVNENSVEILNRELQKVHTWLLINKLSINIKKTKFMVFHNKNKYINYKTVKLNLLEYSIERVEQYNFLGVTLDKNLNWKPHIDNISIKLSRAVGILYKMKHYLPCHILRTLYYSLIMPHLSYGILAWGQCSFLSDVTKLQKRAVRIITNSNYNSHSEPLFKELELLKLQDIFTLILLKFYFNYCHNRLPQYFQSFVFNRQLDLHQHNTRNKHLLQIGVTRTKSA